MTRTKPASTMDDPKVVVFLQILQLQNILSNPRSLVGRPAGGSIDDSCLNPLPCILTTTTSIPNAVYNFLPTNFQQHNSNTWLLCAGRNETALLKELQKLQTFTLPKMYSIGLKKVGPSFSMTIDDRLVESEWQALQRALVRSVRIRIPTSTATPNKLKTA